MTVKLGISIYTIKQVPPVSQGGVLSPHNQNACGTSYCQQQVSQNQQVVMITTQIQRYNNI